MYSKFYYKIAHFSLKLNRNDQPTTYNKSFVYIINWTAVILPTASFVRHVPKFMSPKLLREFLLRKLDDQFVWLTSAPFIPKPDQSGADRPKAVFLPTESKVARRETIYLNIDAFLVGPGQILAEYNGDLDSFIPS
jgi:hypothetical protein